MPEFKSLEGLVSRVLPPLKRRGFSPPEHSDHEHKLSEAAVMLSFANYLFGQGAQEVTICPDGMHGKQFEIREWLLANGFEHTHTEGGTAYGGVYQTGSCKLRVWPHSGHGDVFATIDGLQIVAECKGGVFNSRHSGVLSSLRSGLREAVGSLMERPAVERNIAVVPDSSETAKFAHRMASRAARAGIEIALVSEYGAIRFVNAGS